MGERTKGGTRSSRLDRARAVAALTLGLAACGEPSPQVSSRKGLSRSVPIAAIPAPLPSAHCEVEVEGLGMLDLEADYLPQVVACENNGANLQALKAQAIAARSVAYYAIESSGSICDSQGCQVFSCGQEVTPLHVQAVQETSGQYLMYNATLTYGFYVAGDNSVVAPGCVGNDANAATEHWVTYNQGRSAELVEQTELGYVHQTDEPGYGQNRGCMSQWGGRCLENELDYDAEAILRFYYGDDIEIAKAQGECVLGGGSTGAATTGSDTEGTGSGTTTGLAGSSGTKGEDALGSSGDADTHSVATWSGTAAVGTDAILEGTAQGDPGCGCASGPARLRHLLLLALLGAGGRKRRRPGVQCGRRGA